MLILNLNPSYDHWIRIDSEPTFEHHLRGEGIIKQIDGKGLNIARVLRTLGVDDCRCLNVLGGIAGEIVDRIAAENGIPCRTFWISGDTRMNTAIVHNYPPDPWVQIVNENGPSITRTEVSGLKEVFREEVSKRQLFVISGSAPNGFTPDDLVEITESARQLGTEVAVDIAGPWLKAIVSQPMRTLKVNDEEFSSAFKTDAQNIDELVDFWHRHEIKEIIITYGRKGSLSISEEGVFQATSDEISSNLAVGSGDSFFAGYLASMRMGQTVHERLKLATACGIANAKIYGSALMSHEQIEKDLGSVYVSKKRNGPLSRV